MRVAKKLTDSFYWKNTLSILRQKNTPLQGWGRKRTGRFAVQCAKLLQKDFILLEDGFVRSIGLGVDNAPSFSIVKDDIGIYYDATMPSRLEEILNHYDFENDIVLMQQSQTAIALIEKYHISKYNSAPDVDSKLTTKYALDKKRDRVLVIAQTADDASLKYGLATQFDTNTIIQDAREQNPDADIYLKIHPDVLSGKKSSDTDIRRIDSDCRIIDDDINPLSLLKYFGKVYTKTSQMGFEALLLNKECVCYGMPFYAGWGVTEDRITCDRRTRSLSTEEIFAASYILYTDYHNPYSQKSSNIIDTIQTIEKYRNRDRMINQKAYFFGFSRWKHSFIKAFVTNITSVNFINPLLSQTALDLAIKKGLDKKSRIYIWGKRELADIEQYARENQISIYRVEDGFIRSVSLGSDLTRPYSLAIDRRGIYFDPAQESDLEHILNFHPFSSDELNRAKQIKDQIIKEKLSKYNNYENISLQVPDHQKILLVPGQVEDDASIRYGAVGMSNLKLLQQTRAKAPQAYIIYKPHPDVLAGNKIGKIEDEVALNYCDRIVTEVSLDSILSLSDEVHTMTSLVGFEAIMRGIKVYTYGLPFYAGWGLSVDLYRCERRKRKLSIEELTAGTLLLYPHYIDPLSRRPCNTEVTLRGLKFEREKLKSSTLYRKSLQWRNFISRKLQWLLRLVFRGF
ncbi:MAG: capsular polysaccharide biosynthesis protein [Epsilonproteobacteria bacterium]|nr:MAG: capsular polysaccharide biosynthesis protein [Campylobacterota bacterium]